MSSSEEAASAVSASAAVIPPPFEGQLNKFTNYVKGWQYRWFVLDTEAGTLAYHLLEERHSK